MAMYFADDKDVRDLLKTSKRRLTPEVLRKFLLKRGILVSPEATRDDLFEQIAKWTLDWEEVQWLLDKTAPADRGERYTWTQALGSFKNAEIHKALDTVKRIPLTGQFDSFVVTQTNENTVSVAVTYAEMDPGKTRLRQKRIRDGSLTLDLTEDGVTLRHEANERMAGVAGEVLKSLASIKEEEVKPRRIELEHLTSSEARTCFFLKLLDSIRGLTTQDVSRVQVERSVSDNQSGIALDEITGDDDADSSDEQLEMVGDQVRGAILRGGSLLTSPEFQMLKDAFYLCGMEWTSQESGEKGRMIQFEAAFDNPQSCTGFRYKVKGVIERKKTGDGHEFVKAARACTDIENVTFVRLLEDASRCALDSVEVNTAKIEVGTDSESTIEKGGS